MKIRQQEKSGYFRDHLECRIYSVYILDKEPFRCYIYNIQSWSVECPKWASNFILFHCKKDAADKKGNSNECMMIINNSN